MVFIILGIILIIAIIFSFVFIYNKNRFQEELIRIDEAENNIDMLLQKKIEFIDQIIPIIQKKSKEQEFLSDFHIIREKEKNHFEINEYLKNSYVEIIKILEDNEALMSDKKLNSLLEEMNENEEDLIASIQFYNDHTVEYNRLIHSFPSNMIKTFLKLKHKELYSTEKKEIYEILKK